MSKKPEEKNILIKRLVKIVPYKFLRHYIYPLFIRRKKEHYDGKAFFDSWYGTIGEEEGFSDGKTVDLNFNSYLSYYHYNVTENAIFEFFLTQDKEMPANASVIDIGPGAGHWINFYKDKFGAKSILGVDISEVCINNLSKLYENDTSVKLLNADVSDSSFVLEKQVDVVNAIGVMFHIVNDDNWKTAISNISKALKPGGLFIVGGQFGILTQNVQFHKDDKFSDKDELVSYTSFKELSQHKSKVVRVNKRVRSKKKWISEAKKNNLKFLGISKTRENKSFVIPENNIVVFQKQ